MNTKFRPGRTRDISAAAFAVTSSTFALLLASGCTNYSEDGKPPADPTFATTQVRTFSAAGSTFIAPLMSRWSTDYEKVHNVRVNYRSIGSGAGLSELKQGLLTFAVSDAPLSDSQLKDLPALVQVPVTAGPVCVIYNLPGLNAPLRFSGKTLADIYSGGMLTGRTLPSPGKTPVSNCPTPGSWSSIARMAAEPPVSLLAISAVSAQAGPQRSVMVLMSIGQSV